VDNVLNLFYSPTNPDDIALLQEQKRFVTLSLSVLRWLILKANFQSIPDDRLIVSRPSPVEWSRAIIPSPPRAFGRSGNSIAGGDYVLYSFHQPLLPPFPVCVAGAIISPGVTQSFAYRNHSFPFPPKFNTWSVAAYVASPSIKYLPFIQVTYEETN
jgi:hypothetical protein